MNRSKDNKHAMGKIKQYSAAYKFARVVDCLRKDNLEEVGRQHSVSPKLLSKWQIRFIEQGYKVFESEAGNENARLQKQIAKLEQALGKKEIELLFMKNFLEDSVSGNGN
jgi:transposase-like protein